MRRAYADLEAAGLIVRRQGQGSFVADGVEQASAQRARAEAIEVLRAAVTPPDDGKRTRVALSEDCKCGKCQDTFDSVLFVLCFLFYLFMMSINVICYFNFFIIIMLLYCTVCLRLVVICFICFFIK